MLTRNDTSIRHALQPSRRKSHKTALLRDRPRQCLRRSCPDRTRITHIVHLGDACASAAEITAESGGLGILLREARGGRGSAEGAAGDGEELFGAARIGDVAEGLG
jgi:hypothetical protein